MKKVIGSIFLSIFMVLGCQTLKSDMKSNSHSDCQATAPDIPVGELRYPASEGPLREIREWLSGFSTSELIRGGREYIAEIKKQFNNKISNLNIQTSVDMTVLAGIPDPDNKASRDKIHVIDIAFLYIPTDEPGAIIRHIRREVTTTNGAFARSNVNARLRIVAINPSLGLGSMNQALKGPIMYFMQNQLSKLRRVYGADLAYAVINEKTSFCGNASIRERGTSQWAASKWNAIGIIVVDSSCLRRAILAHEVGHNLGLVHERPAKNEDNPQREIPFVRMGRAYASPAPCSYDPNNFSYGSIMVSRRPCIPRTRFSTDEPWGKQRILGGVDANASEALLYTIEDASNYAPTVLPKNYIWREDHIAQ